MPKTEKNAKPKRKNKYFIVNVVTLLRLKNQIIKNI